MKSDNKNREQYSGDVEAQERRKLRAQKLDRSGNWSSMAVSGLVGWAIVIPTLAGALLGRWLDKSYPSERSWTLVLLVAGLVFGCWNAWRWLAEQNSRIEEEPSD